MATRLELVLAREDGSGRSVCATLTWPAALEVEARQFLCDNLLMERLGDARRVHAALEGGRISTAERARFLADHPVFLPEPPPALAAAIDLEELVAGFATGLAAYRAASPDLELRLEFS